MNTQLRSATLLLILLANVAHAAPRGAAPRAPSVEGPSRKNPVMGFNEQTSSRSPSTLRDDLRRPPPLPMLRHSTHISAIVFASCTPFG
jgi:hypothetical protein